MPLQQKQRAWYDLHYGRFGYLVLFGATIGALLDYLHTDGGAILYPPDTNHWRGILTFSLVYSVGGVLFALFSRFFNGTGQPPVPFSHSAWTVVVYSILYAYTAYLDTNSVQTCAMILAAALGFWWYQDRTVTGLVACAICASMGGSVEAMYSHLGIMAYSTQDVAYLPYWLPAIYFCSTATWGHVARRVLEVTDHRSPLYCPERKLKSFKEVLERRQ